MPLISLEDVRIHAGYVEKLPVSMHGLGLWRQRYLVLIRSQLQWYTKQEHSERISEELGLAAADLLPLGKMVLSQDTVVDVSTAGCLCIRVQAQTLWIRAAQPELRQWAEAIEGVLVRPKVHYADSFVEVQGCPATTSLTPHCPPTPDYFHE